jgi:DNA-binding MarR family transcriptional regulator
MKRPPENPAIPRLIGLVRTLRDCCQRQEGEICHQLDLTASQFACLLAIPETSDLTVHQVAKAMGLSPSRASRIVDSLVRHGFLDRKTTDKDRRQQILALTPAGRTKWQTAHQLLVGCEQKLLSHLSAQHSLELAEAFQKVINALVQGTKPKKAGNDSTLTVSAK